MDDIAKVTGLGALLRWVGELLRSTPVHLQLELTDEDPKELLIEIPEEAVASLLEGQELISIVLEEGTCPIGRT